jgi:hypothetical protein
MKNLEIFLKNLDTLKLNSGEYCIVSSGSLAARGIRDCNDLDIICTDRLWNELKQKFLKDIRVVSGICTTISPVEHVEFLGEFETVDDLYTSAYQIEHADIIDGKRYQNLETIKYFKQISGREKDISDIQLIEKFEKNKLLSDAINDWPTPNCNDPKIFLSEIKEFFGCYPNYFEFKEYKFDYSRGLWEAEACSSLEDLYNFYDKNKKIDEIITGIIQNNDYEDFL